jgi:hypothetical protein
VSKEIKVNAITEKVFLISTVNSTSDYTLWTLRRSYFEGITANIELQVKSVMLDTVQ